ncbi:uncharacterized protein L969DRAFT_43254 [Mixia osmundae IAM 14324]|uniref:Peptidase S49 domain-containing protein n=1 Tax=Mixia osmundae (strain CBS 9802 / IAM 14324 / JCM 22182 / KY 12970) TaxID=764103 RepID=G7E4K9_MIXOS|nr:uncharacterized protein L969DRAFT_43254 [Mixia osmundae IAM 14324]KEI41851.1 hypothetical protein L969DRAFT_43254 [Mixia osmundae IAM 14324]GAA97769.1 hypothetical protein E5Q_04448 [Mixia osmundae IAM 14324]
MIPAKTAVRLRTRASRAALFAQARRSLTPYAGAAAEKSKPASAQASTATATTSAAKGGQPASASEAPQQLSRRAQWKGRYDRARQSYAWQATAFVWNRKLFFGGLLTSGYIYYELKRWQYYQDDRAQIKPNTAVVWKIYPGSIVETASSKSALSTVLGETNPYAEESAQPISLLEALTSLAVIAQDDNVRLLVANFSSLGVPTAAGGGLGLAQIEELLNAIQVVKSTKTERGIPFRTIAFSDSFDSQGEYLLACAFDEIYMQPTGQVGLTGLSAEIPFYKRLLDWAGVRILSETRERFKSVTAPYVHEELPLAQRENQQEVMQQLSDAMALMIGEGRFPDLPLSEATAKVREMMKHGPYSATEAAFNGLITGPAYMSDIAQAIGIWDANRATPYAAYSAYLDTLQSDQDPAPFAAESPPGLTAEIAAATAALENSDTGTNTASETDNADAIKPHVLSFKQLSQALKSKTTEVINKPATDEQLRFGICYLNGGINAGASTDKVLQGIAQAGRDKSIVALILRIDSGGGAVIPSDSIWEAIAAFKSTGRAVIASLGNTAASGAYMAACGADVIFCNASTITGSIGVAAIRPTITQKLLDRAKLNVQSFVTGNTSQSLLHELEGDALARFQRHVDETYSDFLLRVVQGRDIPLDNVHEVAQGRVFTGIGAFRLKENLKLDHIDPWSSALLSNLQWFVDAKSSDDERAVEQGSSPQHAELDEDHNFSPFAVISKLAGDCLPSQPSLATGAETKHRGLGLVDALAGLEGAMTIAAATTLEHRQLGKKSAPAKLENAEDLKKELEKYDVLPVIFPRELSLLQQIKAAYKQGDGLLATMGITAVLLGQRLTLFGQTVTREMIKSTVTAEVNALGMGDLMTKDAFSAKRGLRAESGARYYRL